MANLTEVFVPDVGDDAVEVIEICVAVGDSIEQEDALITVESDKASMDIPAPMAGTVSEIKVAVGDKVSQGDLVAMMEAGAAAAAPEAASESEVTSEPEASTPTPAPAEAASTPTQAPAPAGDQVIEVHVPDIGSDGEVDIIEVMAKVGDSVEKEDGLITLETDKATMDVPSPEAGIIEAVHVEVGGKVGQGALIVSLKVSGGEVAAVSTPTPEPATAPTPASTPAPTPAAVDAPKAPPVPHHPHASSANASASVYATPSVRRLAREFGVDLTKVKGSGRKNRILKEDVQSYVKYELSRPKATAAANISNGSGGLQLIPPPKVDFSKFGEVEEVPLTRIQKISGPNLHRNWVTIPHVTQFDEADITEMEAFRKQENATLAKQKSSLKVTPLVFIMKAVAKTLAAYPVFNSSLSEDGEHLVMKKYFHIGIAVDTPNGLVVPVIRDVDKKGLYQLSEELTEVSIRARDGKLTAKDMQGSCFTISSLGGIGGTAFTPIVNAPDVAILGVSRSEMKPKWNGTEFIPRLMLPLSLSYDHRVIDGAVAARFSVHLSAVLSDIRKLIL